jgi:hypothetical protein
MNNFRFRRWVTTNDGTCNFFWSDSLLSTFHVTHLLQPKLYVDIFAFRALNPSQLSSLYFTLPVWWPVLKNSPTVIHACRKRQLKWVPSAWGIAGPPCLRESWMLRPGPLGWGLGAGLTIQPCRKVIVMKPQNGRPGPDLGCRVIWWYFILWVCIGVQENKMFWAEWMPIFPTIILFWNPWWIFCYSRSYTFWILADFRMIC